MRYKVSGEHIIDTTNHRVVMTLSLPKWEATLNLECKILNGERVAKWVDGVLIFVPPAKNARCSST